MILSGEQLKQVVSAGGGLILDASVVTANQLKDLARAAKDSGARVVLRNVTALTAVQLVELGALAPGLILFDLTAWG